jgi:hypothetical protein
VLLGTYENQDEVQMKLRNGVHKYQPIILAAGSIAPEKRKSMKTPTNFCDSSRVFPPDQGEKCRSKDNTEERD